MKNPKKAIILAAGRGTRLKPLTDKTHKCLTRINGIPILVNALTNLDKCGFEECLVVVGYLNKQIKREIGLIRFNNLNVRFVHNPIYLNTHTSYSLWLALKEIEEDVIIMEGDVFFERSMLENLIKFDFENSTVLEKYNPTLDGTFVSISGDNIVTDWIHKKDRPAGFTIEDKYKTVNIHRFSKKFIANKITPILNKHIIEQGGSRPMECLFGDLVREGEVIHGYITKEKWFEIDTIEDLQIAENIFKDVTF